MRYDLADFRRLDGRSITLADPNAGGLEEEVIAVCEHYLGRPKCREGAVGASEERVMWRCGKCGGDFVAGGGRAGCPDLSCPVPHNATAFDLVAFFEGKRKDKDLLATIRTVRKLAAERSSAVARIKAEERARAAEARRTKKGRGKEDTDGEPNAAGKGSQEIERGGPPARLEDGGANRGRKAKGLSIDAREWNEFAAWRDQKERERGEESRCRQKELREVERRKAIERHWELADRVVAAFAWATPRELAEAAAVALCVGACVWAALVGAEVVIDWIVEFFGGAGLPDYEVGRFEVGHLGVYSPLGAETAPTVSWTSIRERLQGLTEALWERYRLLLGVVVGAVSGAISGWCRSADRRATNAFALHERLELRTDEGER